MIGVRGHGLGINGCGWSMTVRLRKYLPEECLLMSLRQHLKRTLLLLLVPNESNGLGPVNIYSGPSCSKSQPPGCAAKAVPIATPMMALRNPDHIHQQMRNRKEGRKPSLGWGHWQWVALTWAHPGCPHTGPHADMGSDLGSRSPPASRRPFLGEEEARGSRCQNPLWSPCRHWRPQRMGMPCPCNAYLCTAEGTGRCNCPHRPHRHPR